MRRALAALALAALALGLSASPAAAACGDEDSDGGCTVLERLIPGGQAGPYPTDNYDLGYDQGAWNHWGRQLSGHVLNLIFGLARWLVGIGLWILDWALGFGFANRLAAPAIDIAQRWEDRVITPSGFGVLALTITSLWALWLGMTNRLTRGLAEIGISAVIAALALTAWARPAAWLNDSLDLASDVGQEVAVAISDDSSTVTGALHAAFVERPHQVLNWGELIPAGHRCFDVYNDMVADGPHGSSDKPRDAMDAAGCGTLADYNHDPSPGRILGAVLLLAAAAVVMVLLVVLAASLIGAQLAALVALALSPFGIASGLLPGRGRALFWRWVTSIMVALAGIVAWMMMLALVLAGIQVLMNATASDPIGVQLAAPSLVVVVALYKRRSIVEGTRRAAATMTTTLANATPGANVARTNWQGFGGGVVATGATMLAYRALHRSSNGYQPTSRPELGQEAEQLRAVRSREMLGFDTARTTSWQPLSRPAAPRQPVGAR